MCLANFFRFKKLTILEKMGKPSRKGQKKPANPEKTGKSRRNQQKP